MTFGVFARNTAYLIAPPNVLPEGILRSFTIINKIHWVWRLCRLGERVQNDNVLDIIAKKGFGILVGDSRLMQVVAQLVLGARRINDCIDGYIELSYAYQKLVDAVKNNYPLFEEKPWDPDISFRWIPPSRYNALQTSFEDNVQYVTRITENFFYLNRSLFTLSMLALDAVDAFYLSPSSQQESIEELGPNTMKIIDEFSKDAVFLHEKLIANKELVNRILREGGASFTIDQVINIVGYLVSGSKSVNNVVEEVAPVTDALSMVGDVLLETTKKIASGFAYGLGGSQLLNQLPRWIRPKYTPPRSPVKRKEKVERYVPEHTVTRLDMQPISVPRVSNDEEIEMKMPSPISQEKLKLLNALF
jgi:hypothetical protein